MWYGRFQLPGIASSLTLWIYIFVFLMSQNVKAFNIEVDSSVSFYGPNNSNFGFSVAQWWQGDTPVLVVGAPGGSANNAGGVFLCRLNDSTSMEKSCQLFGDDYNLTDPVVVTQPLIDLGKGFHVATGSRQGAPLLVCSPQSYFRRVKGTEKNQFPVGQCHLLDSERQTGVRIRPDSEELEKFVYCGYSAAFAKNDTAVVISCPRLIDERSKAKFLTYNLVSKELNQDNFTEECQKDFLSGCAITVKNSDKVALTCGSMGPIIETDEHSSFETLLAKNQSRIGEMVGYSLEACDVDGDGIDEVLVGVPFGRVDQRYGWAETGKVIVLGKNESQTIKGTTDFSRFGSSVACVGDLNKDGFEDVAVGAPQDREGGAIFIFFGSKQGLQSNASQEIRGSEINSTLKGFGFSITGRHDGDFNGYPDILVGAPQSDMAVFLRTAPVIRLNISFHFNRDTIDLDYTNHTANESQRESFSLFVEIKPISSEPVDLDLNLQVKLDAGRTRKRVLFLSNEEASSDETVRVNDTSLKLEFEVYVEDLASPEDILEKSTAILSVSILRVNSDKSGSPPSKFEDPRMPGLEWLGQEYRTSVRLVCSKNISSCVATTNVQIAADNALRLPFHVGPYELQVNMTLSVEYNTAFDPAFSVSNVQGLTLKSAFVTNRSLGLLCEENTTCSANNTICTARHNCHFPQRKLRAGDEIKITLVFKQNSVDIIGLIGNISEPELNMYIQASVFNEDINRDDDTINMILLPIVMPDFTLIGGSVPETISITHVESHYTQAELKKLENRSYVINNSSANRVGPAVKHLYNVTAKGDIGFKEVQVDVHWPVLNRTDDAILSLLTSEPRYSDPEKGICFQKGVLDNKGLQKDAPCSVFVCVAFGCNVTGSGMLIIEAVVATSFFKEDVKNFQLQSNVTAEVVRPVSWRTLQNHSATREKTVSTIVNVPQTTDDSGPPVWIVAISVVGGLLLLALLSYGLYRLGFFKRKVIPQRTEGDGKRGEQETEDPEKED